MNATYRGPGGLAALAAATAIGLAACSGPSSPHVASLGKGTGTNGSPSMKTSGGGHPTTSPVNRATTVLNKWAACMRSHGDPNQAGPTITADKLININWDPAIPGGYNGTYKGGQGNLGPGQYCRSYLNAAQEALGNGSSNGPNYSTEQLDRYAACMRANGIPDFPDPSGGRLVMSIGGDLNPSNPTFQKASKTCATQTGVKAFSGTPAPGSIELDGSLPGGQPGG